MVGMIINLKRDEKIKKMLCSCEDGCNSEDYFKKLQGLGEELKFREEFINLPNFALALASKERLIIINSLKEKDRCVCELEVILSKSQSTISHHLRKLERANLITGYKKGNFTYYSRNQEILNEYLKLLKIELAI